MSADAERLLPPNEPAAFESLCLDLWREIWGDPGAQKNGRSGQPQAGVDVFGRSGGVQVGVQCKQKDGLLHTKVTAADLEREVDLARSFRPPLGRFVLATSGPRDAKVQKRARELNEEGFEVQVWSWEDMWHELYQRRELLRRLLPVYWPMRAGIRRQLLAPTRLRHAPERLFGRESELAALDAAWADSALHVVTLVAWGGVGKTSLVSKWVGQLAKRDFDGADYFDWSFFSQGNREQGAASADPFVDAALRFFGDDGMADSTLSPWDKGARLAQLVAERRTLLVLDGIEPLQHPPGPLGGELRDLALVALLKGLAQRNNGLCLVTTRERVEDLAAFEGSTALRWELDRLSSDAGIALLRALGVHGAGAELERLIEDVRGHALTLNLLGRYLHGAHGGDVRRRDRVRLDEADAEVQGGLAFKVMEAYERWFAGEGEQGEHLLAVLELLGLFDRPAVAELLSLLRRPPAIPGLTDAIVGLSEDRWNLAVTRLAEHGLVTRDGECIDSHPLVREHFGCRSRERSLLGWKAGHGRLFDLLKKSTVYRPTTLDGLRPLYQAVAHGCQAGRQQEACSEVYIDRILRGTGGSGFYSTKRLGAFGADLNAVACFFDLPWSRVSQALRETDRAWLLSVASLHLRALGRLSEALEPMHEALRMALVREDWRQGARRAGNVSEIELALGQIAAALRDAEESVVFADRSGEPFEQIGNRARLADALHQAGREEEALALFSDAEATQARRQPEYRLLYSLRGFRFCDLLLAGAERAAGGGPGSAVTLDDIEKRAVSALESTIQNVSLERALGHLTIGRAQLYRALLAGTAPCAAKGHVEHAVEELRSAGTRHHLPRGLLTRSWLRSALGDAAGARADLDEAEEIAERGPMPLHLADVHLYRARLFHDRAALAEARRLVEKHGYGRRREELADLEAVADGW